MEQAGVTRLWGLADFKAAATFKIPVHTAAALIFDGDSKPVIFISGMDRIIKRILPLDSVTESFEARPP